MLPPLLLSRKEGLLYVLPVSIVVTDLCPEAIPIQLLELRGNIFSSYAFLTLLLLSYNSLR